VEAALVKVATYFARTVIAPNAGTWDRTNTHTPRTVVQDWGARGLNALQVSVERGGSGAGFHARLAVAEAIARVCVPSAFVLIVIQGSVTRMEREGSAEQIARYLPGLMSDEIIGASSLT
jgi:alkylation response protein AidB-like acyl-CoA dehydrogenase